MAQIASSEVRGWSVSAAPDDAGATERAELPKSVSGSEEAARFRQLAVISATVACFVALGSSLSVQPWPSRAELAAVSQFEFLSRASSVAARVRDGERPEAEGASG